MPVPNHIDSRQQKLQKKQHVLVAEEGLISHIEINSTSLILNMLLTTSLSAAVSQQLLYNLTLYLNSDAC